jgi:23S rRNA C2498 (ribose-2'-O)-methylase RlmM
MLRADITGAPCWQHQRRVQQQLHVACRHRCCCTAGYIINNNNSSKFDCTTAPSLLSSSLHPSLSTYKQRESIDLH